MNASGHPTLYAISAVRIAYVCLAIFCSSTSQAALLWDESEHGDLPDLLFADDLYPNLLLQPGENVIRGSSSWLARNGEHDFDSDRARLTLAPGLTINNFDYVFSNISYSPPWPNPDFVVMSAGYALTRGDYSTDDAVIIRFWEFLADPNRAEFGGDAKNELPLDEPGNNYLFGTWVHSASIPSDATYRWDYSATITVSGVPLPAPAHTGLLALSLLLLWRKQSRRTSRDLHQSDFGFLQRTLQGLARY